MLAPFSLNVFDVDLKGIKREMEVFKISKLAPQIS